MKEISLQAERAEILAVARSWFNRIMALPTDVRADVKQRTGIQVLVHNLDTRELINASIGEPSERAVFYAAEKAVRSELYEEKTSEDSADPELCRYPGSVTFSYHKVSIQASISELKSEEEVLIAVMILSYIFQYPPASICAQLISENSELPDAAFDEDNYLYEFFHSEEVSDVINLQKL